MTKTTINRVTYAMDVTIDAILTIFRGRRHHNLTGGRLDCLRVRANGAHGPEKLRPRGRLERRPMYEVYRDIDQHLPHLRRYAQAVSHNPVAADDLVRKSVIKALAKAHLYRPGTDPRGCSRSSTISRCWRPVAPRPRASRPLTCPPARSRPGPAPGTDSETDSATVGGQSRRRRKRRAGTPTWSWSPSRKRCG